MCADLTLPLWSREVVSDETSAQKKCISDAGW